MSMRKVTSGENLHIEATTFNAMIDAAEAHKRLGASAKGRGGNIDTQNATLYVRNDSGSDVPRFGVLGLGAPIITPTNNLVEWQNNFSFIGENPLIATHGHKIAITQEPIAAGKIGRAKITGLTPVQIDITDITHTHATLVDADLTKLASSVDGASIIWSDAVVGIGWGLIDISKRRSGLFAVKVFQDGGITDGDATTQCDRTYTALSLDAITPITGTEIATLLTPEKVRPTMGKLVVPTTIVVTVGVGYYGADKLFHLWDANEALDTEACV